MSTISGLTVNIMEMIYNCPIIFFIIIFAVKIIYDNAY